MFFWTSQNSEFTNNTYLQSWYEIYKYLFQLILNKYVSIYKFKCRIEET